MDYQGNDIYCDMIVPRLIDINVAEETDNVLAYYHTKPFWPVHVVVTPKHHVDSLIELDGELQIEILEIIKRIARQIKDEHGACSVMTNLGAYQDSKHLHFHIHSGDKLR